MEHPFARLVGLPGHRLLRADLALRRARTTSARSSTGCTQAGHRRDPRLGARRTSRRTTGRSRRFDGTALYEHDDPRRGEHPDWGTLVFNYGRNEVRNFLLASALFWLREYHADGLRVDAVASMLYLDYSRKAGRVGAERLRRPREPRRHRVPAGAERRSRTRASPGVLIGGRGVDRVAGRLAAAVPRRARLRPQVEHGLDARHARLLRSATRSTARYHHNQLTFSLLYAFSENFVLPLSHDEVVHGKGSLLEKMPGDRWQQLANLRALYGYMWAHPGKKLLFMGGEFGQERSGTTTGSLDWHLLETPEHAGIQALVRDLNLRYRDEPALWEVDFEPAGFRWLEAERRRRQRARVRAPRADGERVSSSASATSRRSARPVPRRPPARRRLARAAEHRRRALRRLRRRQPGGSRRRRSRGTTSPSRRSSTLPPLGVLWLAPVAWREERGERAADRGDDDDRPDLEDDVDDPAGGGQRVLQLRGDSQQLNGREEDRVAEAVDLGAVGVALR